MEAEVLVKKLLALKDTDCVELDNGTIITRLEGDFQTEWKVSPFGSEGDYDRDCLWLFQEELAENIPAVLGT